MPTNDFDSRIKGLEKNLGENEEISSQNRELLKDFKRDMEVQNYSKGRIYKVISLLKVVGEHVDYDFEDADLDEIKDTVAWINKRDVSDATKTDYRTILKMLYKWMNDGKYP